MLYQVGPCPLLEFIESCFKERSQLWRGMGRHGDEGTCLAEDRWGIVDGQEWVGGVGL